MIWQILQGVYNVGSTVYDAWDDWGGSSSGGGGYMSDCQLWEESLTWLRTQEDDVDVADEIKELEEALATYCYGSGDSSSSSSSSSSSLLLVAAVIGAGLFLARR